MRWLRLLPLVALVLYLATGIVQVRRGERGVVRRFGRVLPETAEPGLWVGLPWGMDRVDRVSVDSVRSVEVGYDPEGEADEMAMPPGQLLTGDNNLVNVRAVLYYKVRPDEAASFVLHRDEVPGVLSRLVEASMAEWVATKTVDEVLLRGKTAMRGDLILRTRKRVGEYKLGIEILDARVERIAPPPEVKDSFDSVAQAQTRIAIRKNQAEQEAAARKRDALAAKYRTEQQALSYAERRELLARREAESFTKRLKQYRLAKESNPDYLMQIWQEAMGTLLVKLKETGLRDVLDDKLMGELELFTAPPLPGR